MIVWIDKVNWNWLQIKISKFYLIDPSQIIGCNLNSISTRCAPKKTLSCVTAAVSEVVVMSDIRDIFHNIKYAFISADLQKHPILHESHIIISCAERRRNKIVRTYADHGKSRLSFGKQASLRRLLSELALSRADFNIILIYDVCPWCRFQDVDESTYWN